MSSLKSLTQTVMLGSAGEILVEQVADAFQVPIPDSDPEAGLLACAAVAGIGEMGGLKPVTLEGAEPPCLPEEQPQMSEGAAALLKRLLAGEFEAALPEFLGLATSRGRIAPPEVLPALLGISKKELRPLVRAISGERGRWLSRHNPAWAFMTASPDEEAWETGRFEHRLEILQRVRASNPGAAREMVRSTWDQDSPEARAAFVTTFSAGLSMEDEPFLEGCLDDKRKEVRDAALNLLPRLRGSRLVERAVGRLDTLLNLRSRRLGGDVLEARLPEKVDAAAERDGAGGAAVRKNMGKQADILVKMLSVVPPSIWGERWNRPPEKLVQAALASEWKAAVLTGWLLAAERCADAPWAEALVELAIRAAEGRAVLAETGLGGIAPLVPVSRLEKLAGSSITPRINDLDDRHPLLDLLEAYTLPWSDQLARTVMASVRRQAGGPHWRLMQALPGFGLRIPPALAEECSAGWPENARGWDTRIDQLIAVLRFRKEMMEVL